MSPWCRRWSSSRKTSAITVRDGSSQKNTLPLLLNSSDSIGLILLPYRGTNTGEEERRAWEEKREGGAQCISEVIRTDAAEYSEPQFWFCVSDRKRGARARENKLEKYRKATLQKSARKKKKKPEKMNKEPGGQRKKSDWWRTKRVSLLMGKVKRKSQLSL